MSIRTPLFLLAWLVITAVSHGAGAAPNVLLIYVDDMGYADPSCYGGTMVATPNIDRLAAEGLKFTSAYVSAPVCGPSRTGLLTGAYQQRFGVYWNQDTKEMKLLQGHLLLPQVLKQAGYATGVFGKWNVQMKPAAVFDVARDIMDWEGDYFPDAKGHYTGVDTPSEHASSKVQGVWGPAREGDEYLTDRIARHALEFIETKREQPWFAYLAFNAPHSPFQAKKQYREDFPGLTGSLAFYAAMIRSLDENIGRVLDRLAALDLTKDTLILFASDNGPAPALRVGWHDDWPKDTIHGSAGPFRGYKGQYYEGGNRVPLIMSWPGHLQPGTVYEAPVSIMDLYPTICTAAGAAVPAGTTLDGCDLWPWIKGERKGRPHATLFWAGPPDVGAMRQEDWKLVCGYGKPQLFDLARDPGEANDLSQQKPELTAELIKAWQTWLAKMPKPNSSKSADGE
jgi:arylsulfatase A-like enzyme